MAGALILYSILPMALLCLVLLAAVLISSLTRSPRRAGEGAQPAGATTRRQEKSRGYAVSHA